MITEADKLHFECMCQRFAREELCGEGIGTYSEKRLHKILKYYFCPSPSCHEVRIDKNGQAVIRDGGECAAESGRGGYIADIFDNGHIIEIQTGGFYPMKNKIRFYLENTDYKITVVHPLAAIKWVSWINTEDGSVSKRSKSPKKCGASDILPELYWLSDFLKNDRLSFKILLVELDEFRLLNGWSYDKKRGSERYERVPVQLCDIVDFKAPDFVKFVVPQGLPQQFVSKELSNATKLKGRKLSYALKLLCDSGAIKRGERTAQGYVYTRMI